MLQAYYRHRFLEIAGRYDEIFVPEMTVEKSVYHVLPVANTRSSRDRMPSRGR
jgi:hypothetical protein